MMHEPGPEEFLWPPAFFIKKARAFLGTGASCEWMMHKIKIGDCANDGNAYASSCGTL